MIVPKLKPSGRDREFLKYNNKQRSEVVIGWLFKGEYHRELDIKVLSLGFKSLGFQSMGILHYLGLKKEFKSIFKNHSIKESVSYLELDSQDFSEVIKLITYAEVIKESDSLNMDCNDCDCDCESNDCESNDCESNDCDCNDCK